MSNSIGLIDLVLVSPLLILFFASLIPLTSKVLRGNHEPSQGAVLSYGAMGLIGAMIGIILSQDGVSQKIFANALVIDGVSRFAGVLALAAALGALILSKEHIHTYKKQYSEFVFLFLNSCIGMLIVVSSMDLVMLFIGIELMSLSSYILVALSRDSRLAKEAALKYFVLGSVASAILLYGISFVYGTSGTTNLSVLVEGSAELVETSKLFGLGLILIIVGLSFKVSIVPFHAWTPDVYQGAPTPISAFMATSIKVALMVVFLRFMNSVEFLNAEGPNPLMSVLQWLAALTILVGNIAAVIQTSVKRMLAYSSIAHSGFLLIGLIVSGVRSSGFGTGSVLFYLLSYAIMTIGSFALVNLLEHKEGKTLFIDDLKGMAKHHPVIAICLSILLLSLTGIPPLVGFFGKFFIFSAALQEGFLWLAVWGVLGSVVSVYYYLRPIVNMYMFEGDSPLPASGFLSSKAILVVSATLTLLCGIFVEPVFQLVLNSIR